MIGESWGKLGKIGWTRKWIVGDRKWIGEDRKRIGEGRRRYRE